MSHELKHFIEVLSERMINANRLEFASRRIDEYIDDAAHDKGPPFLTIVERLWIPIPEKGY